MGIEVFKKNPISSIKNKVVELLQNSKIFVQRNEINYIDNVLNTSDIIESFIPSAPIEIGPINSKDINSRLEGCYIDHLIQYQKLKTIIEGMEETRDLYINKVSNIADQVLEKESKLEAFIRTQGNNGLYNNVIHESFIQDNNYDGTDRKLSVNRSAGTLRLDSSSRNLVTKETSNISYEIITEGIELIDESPLDNLYNRNIFYPWYVSLISKNFIRNQQYSNLDLSDYLGAVILLRITFPSSQQINRLNYNSFSTDNLDLLGIFYSNYYNQDLNSRNIIKVDLSSYQSNQGLSKEVNFFDIIADNAQIINANEVIVVLGQTNYISISNNSDYDIPINIDETIKELKKEERETRIKNKSLKSLVSSNDLINETNILQKVSKINLKEGDKNYIIGLSLLSIENNIYDAFGSFRTKNYEINGNAFGFAIDINKKKYPINLGMELVYININGRKLPIASLDPEERVKDMCIIKTISIQDNKYLGFTNFIPKTNGDKFENAILYLNGNLLNSNEYRILRKTKFGYEIEIQSELGQDGGQLVMAYKSADVDHLGIPYFPERIEMENIFGRPNLDINFLSKSISDYIYLKSDNTFISYLEGQEVSYTEILNKQYLSVPKLLSKGIENTVNDIKTDFTNEENYFDTDRFFYIPIEKVMGIEYERYQVIKNEKPKIDKGSGFTINWNWEDIKDIDNEYIEMEVEYEYLKNFIVLIINNIEFRLNNDEQYKVDTQDTIQNKKRIQIPKTLLENFIELNINYTPLNNNSATKSNILQPNDQEIFTQGTNNNQIILSRFPYIDNEIINSLRWVVSRGIFYNIENFSIVYEPISILIGNKKAFNATIYREGQNDSFDENDITYTVEDRKITFNVEITERIQVQYYFLGNYFNIEIEMFKADSSKYFITPEMFDFSVFIAVKK